MIMFTLKEVAIELRLSYTSTIKFVRQGKIKAVRVGKQWLVSETELERVKREGTNNERD